MTETLAYEYGQNISPTNIFRKMPLFREFHVKGKLTLMLLVADLANTKYVAKTENLVNGYSSESTYSPRAIR